MILDPNGQPVSTKPRPTIDQQADSLGEMVFRKQNEIVLECLKDVCGGLLPTKKKMKRFLVRERRPDGDLFRWRGELLLWLGTWGIKRTPDGKSHLVLPHKKLYLKVPEQPLGGSN